MELNFSVQLSDIQKKVLIVLNFLGNLDQSDIVRGIAIMDKTDLDQTKLYLLLHQSVGRRMLAGEDFKKTVPDTVEVWKLQSELHLLYGTALVANLADHGTSKICLTSEGKRVAEKILRGRHLVIPPPRALSDMAFVASAFGYSDVDSMCETVIRGACGQHKLRYVRIDDHEPRTTITASVLAGLHSSRCVIADLTYARPSVYFEVGVAHALGVPLLLTCRRDHATGTADTARIHFDLAQFKISYWELRSAGVFAWERGMAPIERLGPLLSIPT